MIKILILLLFAVLGASSKVLVMLLGSGKQEEGAGSDGPEPNEHADLVGAKGKAVTALRPSGFVVIHSKHLAAISEGSFIGRGEAVGVIGVKGNELVVRKT